MVCSPTVGEHLTALRVPVEALSRVRLEDPDLLVDIVLMLEAAPLGSTIDFDAEELSFLAAAGCGLVVDAYEAQP